MYLCDFRTWMVRSVVLFFRGFVGTQAYQCQGNVVNFRCCKISARFLA